MVQLFKVIVLMSVVLVLALVGIMHEVSWTTFSPQSSSNRQEEASVCEYFDFLLLVFRPTLDKKILFYTPFFGSENWEFLGLRPEKLLKVLTESTLVLPDLIFVIFSPHRFSPHKFFFT